MLRMCPSRKQEHNRPPAAVWIAYVRLEDPPGLSPITTVGRFATVEDAPLATDGVWAARVD